jgi:co-chaperonin GroES (HSP10)
MNIKPLRDNLIITRKTPEMTTSAGIILSRTDEADRAIVQFIGPEVVDTQVGDELLVDWNKAYPINKEQFKLNIKDVIAVLG